MSAIAEVGRIAKTLFLLAYVDDEAYRRRILVQLNRGEARHRLARAVFHGQRCELRQRYREGQEDQLGALGLVANAIILWNTRYMDRAITQLQAYGLDIRAEDIAGLSPLGFQHVNMLGRYSFDLPESLARAELRPLRAIPTIPRSRRSRSPNTGFSFRCYSTPCFPETIRAFALQGAPIASMTTAWSMQGDDPETDYYGYTFDVLSRANALSNQVWMVCSNQVKRPPTAGCANYYGHSRIIAPTGKIEAEIGYEEGLVTATVDLHGGIERARTHDFFGLNLLQDRRPEFYGLLARKDIYYQSAVEALIQPTVADGLSERLIPSSVAHN